MISRVAFDAYSRASSDLVAAASSDVVKALRLWLESNRGASVAEAKNYAVELLDGYGAFYGEVASALAAGFYDEQAAAAGMALEDAVTEIAYDGEWVDDKMRWAVSMYKKGDVAGFVGAAAQVSENSVRRSLNATIMRNAKRDKKKGVRFARVPTGFETCAFCFMLATRGAVYYTRETAGEMGQFHRHCDCKVVPGFAINPDAELVEGWRPDEALERLKAIERETAEHVDGKDWQASNAVTASMKLRSPEWLYYGKVPEIEYENNSVIAKNMANKTIRKQHELERKTARKLNELGFETVFQEDERKIEGRLVGFADLKNGMEIKTVYKATSENTFNTHVSSFKKKRDATTLVFDISENGGVTDAEAAELLRSSLSRHKVPHAYLLRHDNSIEIVHAK